MRQRRDVLDGLDVQAGGLQGGDGRLAAGAGALDPHLDLLDAELRRLLGGDLGGPLGGERRALAAALEADRAGRGVAQRVAVGVGDGDDGVVERRLDVGDAPADVAPLLSSSCSWPCRFPWSVVSESAVSEAGRLQSMLTDH